MTGRLYLDLETCNVQGDQREVARPFMKPDKRLKDEDKIAAAREAALDQTALNGLWGEVVAIGYIFDDGDAHSLMRVEVPNEDTLLSTFSDFVGEHIKSTWHGSKGPTLIGHNISGFDIRFLWQRYIVCGLEPPHWLTRCLNARPWDDEKVFDTMIQWAGQYGDRDKRPSLEALCAGLGIEVPETIPGAEVPKAWLEGRYDDIRAHVLADVEAVRAVHRRMVMI